MGIAPNDRWDLDLSVTKITPAAAAAQWSRPLPRILDSSSAGDATSVQTITGIPTDAVRRSRSMADSTTPALALCGSAL